MKTKFTKPKHNSQASFFELSSVLAVGVTLIFAEHAIAFDLAKAGDAVFKPIVDLVNAHYGKGVVAVGGAGALIAPGDLRTKAIGFGIGSALAGLAMIAVKTGYGF